MKKVSIELKPSGTTELHYDPYVKRGNIQLLREGLPVDDPDYLYTYLMRSEAFRKSTFTPEDFDIFMPGQNVTEEKKVPVAFEFHNLTTGHCYVDYIPRVGMTEDDGYTKIPLYK